MAAKCNEMKDDESSTTRVKTRQGKDVDFSCSLFIIYSYNSQLVASWSKHVAGDGAFCRLHAQPCRSDAGTCQPTNLFEILFMALK